MRPVSEGTKRKAASDPFMERCAKCGTPGVQWHHVMFWGRQLDHWWSIVPACPRCHRQVDTNEPIDEDGNTARELFQWVAMIRMPAQAKEKFSKWNWDFERQRLDRKFVHRYWYIAQKIQSSKT